VLSVTYLPPKELYSRVARLFVQGAPGGVSWSSILGGFTDAVALLEQRLASRLQIRRLDSNELVTHLHRCLTGLTHAVTRRGTAPTSTPCSRARSSRAAFAMRR
jgi:hypothetical protein